jgi:hypothetical protein
MAMVVFSFMAKLGKTKTLVLAAILLPATVSFAKCIPFTEAPKHLGETTCVAGKVLNIGESRAGSLFLNFCDDYKACPFTVVVFPSALKNVGDVRQLEGKEIEIHGKIQEWRGRTEIVLRDARQLKGEAAKIPPLPKDYDVQKRGNYSAGQFPRKK